MARAKSIDQNLKAEFDLRRGFSLDLRSLGLFRIAFGFILLCDIFYRLFYITDFYVDGGILPRAPLISQFMNANVISLHLISGQWWVQMVLFLITLLATLSMTLGFYTRLSTFLCWFLVASMQARNHVILHGGDDIFRLMLLWAQFVPLGAEFSLDKYLNPKPAEPNPKQFFDMGTMGFVLQLCSVYFFTALLKWHPVWHTEGSAVYYTLNLDQFASPIGKYFLKFPELLRMITFATVTLEFFGPLLVIMPLRLFNWRLATVFAFIGFHLSLVLTMELGPFPWACMASWLAFLPASFWIVAEKFPYSPILRLSEKIKTISKFRPPEPKVVYGLVNQSLALIFLLMIFYWNLSHLEPLHLKKPQWLHKVVGFTQSYQKWSMFAPYPRKDDGWYVIEGIKYSGEHVNMWNPDQPLSYEKPANVADTYRNTLWRKYLTNLWLKNYNDYRVYFGRYLCRQWNTGREVEDQVNTFYIYYMLEMTPEPGKPADPIKKEGIWRHYCFDKPADWD